MIINSLVEAVKAVRELVHASKMQVQQDESTGRWYLTDTQPGLNDTKHLVEAIMREGVREFLEDSKGFCERRGDPSDLTVGMTREELYEAINCRDRTGALVASTTFGHYSYEELRDEVRAGIGGRVNFGR